MGRGQDFIKSGKVGRVATITIDHPPTNSISTRKFGSDHELEMTPKGVFKIFIPLIGMMGKKNLRVTANALKRYLERT